MCHQRYPSTEEDEAKICTNNIHYRCVVQSSPVDKPLIVCRCGHACVDACVHSCVCAFVCTDTLIFTFLYFLDGNNIPFHL